MSRKSTKEKRKAIPGKSMEQLAKEGKIDKYAHLKSFSDYNKEKVSNEESK
jgi:hypothetical protein